MDRLCRALGRSQLLHPIIPTSRRWEQQADGCNIRQMGSSWDGSSRRMGDPICAGEITTRLCRSRQPADGSSRTQRCSLGWRMRRKEASDDESLHQTVLLLLRRTHSSTCASPKWIQGDL